MTRLKNTTITYKELMDRCVEAPSGNFDAKGHAPTEVDSEEEGGESEEGGFSPDDEEEGEDEAGDVGVAMEEPAVVATPVKVTRCFCTSIVERIIEGVMGDPKHM